MPSCDGEQSFLKFVPLAELSKPNWNNVYKSDSKKQDCIIAVLSDKTIVMKGYQGISERLSFCEKNGATCFLKNLYFCVTILDMHYIPKHDKLLIQMKL